MEYARALLSSGLFHRGGEPACSRALNTARKILNDDPVSVQALVIAGLSLIGLTRVDAAAKYLDRASRIDPERADLKLALGALERHNGDLGASVRHLETACRMAPDAWESHMLLGRSLMLLSRKHGLPKRLIERSQYHLVHALKLNPPPDQLPPMLKDLGVSCMLTSRYREAEKFFIRLRENDEHSTIARYYLGQVAHQLGKYNNAVQHYRQFLRNKPDDPNVLARMAMAWFQLGDYSRARGACNKALIVDPTHVIARHALGCTLLEEGDPTEAIRVFRETLKEHPEHIPSYVELVRTRRTCGDTRWLIQALNAEVRKYDQLPLDNAVDGRKLTRRRIGVILSELKSIGPSTVGATLGAIGQTQDECVRFQLWEMACKMAEGAVADEAATRLREPGKHYDPLLGGEALSTAASLPEPVLTAGLTVEESDLKRGAVERHQPAHDVTQHRENLDTERNKARAYQALILLSIASRRSPAGKALLRNWAETADADMGIAAWAALSLYGEPAAADRLRETTSKRNAPFVEQLLALVSPKTADITPRRVSEGEHTQCSTCNRGPQDTSHMITGGHVVICDRCVFEVWQHRRSLVASDDASCDLCAKSHFEANGLYQHQQSNICSHCIQLSLGLLEREEVDRFLASW